MTNPKTPEEALELVRKQQAEADELTRFAKKVVKSLFSLQRENGFAPRMAQAYRRSDYAAGA